MSTVEPAPTKTLLTAFPHPVGTVVAGSMGCRWVVVDRDGYAFLACCLTHERAGLASGYPPVNRAGIPLWTLTPADGDPETLDCTP